MATRVLIVDDDDAMRTLVRLYIEHHDEFEVVGEADGCKAGIETATELEPDLVTMDYEMPDGNGPECIQGIRKHNPRIQVLGLTGSGPEARQEMIQAGAYAAINKSYMQALVPALSEALSLIGGDPSGGEVEPGTFERLREVIATLEKEAGEALAEQKRVCESRLELAVALRAVLLASENPKYSPDEALNAIRKLTQGVLAPGPLPAPTAASTPSERGERRQAERRA